MRPFHALLITVLILAALAVPLSTGAQMDPGLEQGIKPFGSYSSDFDDISMVNGGLTVKIPFFSFPQRGKKLSLNLMMEYMNSGWSFSFSGQNQGLTVYATNLNYGGFKFDEDQHVYVGAGCGGGGGLAKWPSVFSPDGAAHNLGQTSVNFNYSVFGFESVDSTGFRLSNYQYGATAPTQVPGIITDRNGVQYTQTDFYSTSSPHGPEILGYSKEDPDGNIIKFDDIGTGWADTLARNIPIPPRQGSTKGGNLITDTSGCQGLLPISYTYLWSLPGPGGGTTKVKVCFANVPLKTHFFPTALVECDNCTGGDPNFIQTAVVYNGSSWTTSPSWVFEYNDRDPGDPSTINYGNLTKITFPTGGTVSYAYFPRTTATNNPPGSTGYTRGVMQRTVNANDGTGPHIWTYAFSYSENQTTGTNTVTDPLGNETVYTESGLGGSWSYYPTEVDYYNGSQSGGALLKSIKTDYSFVTIPTGAQNCSANKIVTSVVPIRVTTIWPNGLQTKTETDYDSGSFTFTYDFSSGNTMETYTGSYGIATNKREYDYGSGAAGTLLRTTATSYLALGNSTYLNANILAPPSSVQVTDTGGVQRAYTTYGYDEPGSPQGAHGNQTSVHRWLNTTGGYFVTSNVYDSNGRVTSTTDPNGNQTTFGYSSGYAGSGPTSATNALSQTTSHVYDFNTGLLTSTTDPNNQTASFTYDNLWRLASASHPDGGLDTITRQETSFPFSATLTKKITTSQNYVSANVFDGLGRLSEKQLTSDPQGTDYTVITYDADGRKASETNSYRTTGDSTYGITQNQYDALNRTTLVIKPDGSKITTSYSGNSTTVTDEAGKTRESLTDGLGRLTQVTENPGGLNYLTTYNFDALDDLIGVVQGGSHNRSFVYDSLKRLTTSTNPESGTVIYGYDGDNNVISKADARRITVNYSYDKLNRLTGRTYSNGDPSVSYFYDQATCVAGETACYNIGRRTGMTDAGGSEAVSYDQMGREWAEQRTTNGITRITGYTYNFDGSLATLTYPSGRIITYTTDSARRLSNAADRANNISYVLGSCPNGSSGANGLPTTGTCYAAQGALAAFSLGGQINVTKIYNQRLQPCWIYATAGTGLTTTTACNATDSTPGSILDLQYNFNLGHDNGNVMGITNNRDSTRSQTFTYDQVNRILTAQASPWSQTFGYDQWANLISVIALGTAPPSLNQSVNANNQITTGGFSYDAAGNETSDVTLTYTWNAESQVKSAGGVNYTYDGDGNRVMKSNGKIYWYGAGTEILDESDASGNITDEYVFFAGKRIAHRSPGTSAALVDLNSTFQTYTSLPLSCGTGCTYNDGPIPYWTSSAPSGSMHPGPGQYSSLPAGPIVAYSNGGEIYQNSFSNWLPNATYTLSVQVGHRLDGDVADYLIALEPQCPSSTTLTSTIGSNASIPPGSWKTVTLTFSTSNTVPSSGYPCIVLQSDGTQIDFASVQLSVSNTISYYVEDLLGSSRTIVQNGQANYCYDADFYPYGGERIVTNTCPQNYKFTGKERDSETGNDNFGARSYASVYGRFISPDPKFAITHILDPQTLNRYAYARNNPVLYIDPDGRDFAKAWEDVKTFARSISIKVSIGVGLEAKGKAGKLEGKVGVAYKANIETSPDAILKISRSVEGGADAGGPVGPKIGESGEAEKPVLTINNDKSVQIGGNPEGTVTDTIGGNTTANTSGDKIAVGVEGGVLVIGGGQVGTTKGGLAALKNAAHEVGDSVQVPPPPPAPTPPPPPPAESTHE